MYDTILKVTGLTKNFRSRCAVKSVSLEIPYPCVYGILGPNGAGKSTLLKCIYRVLLPTAGAVYLDHRALNSYPCKESARCIAVVAHLN